MQICTRRINMDSNSTKEMQSLLQALENAAVNQAAMLEKIGVLQQDMEVSEEGLSALTKDMNSVSSAVATLTEDSQTILKNYKQLFDQTAGLTVKISALEDELDQLKSVLR